MIFFHWVVALAIRSFCWRWPESPHPKIAASRQTVPDTMRGSPALKPYFCQPAHANDTPVKTLRWSHCPSV